MVEAISQAAALVRLPGAVLSHLSAARQWGIELVEDDGSEWLTIPRNSGRYSLPGWRLRRSDLPPEDSVLVNELRVSSVRRTLRDLAVVLTGVTPVAAMDSALRQRLITSAGLAAYAARMRGPGAALVQQVAADADPRCGSVLESQLRVLLQRAGLPPFRTQHVIRDEAGGFVARVDFCWPGQRLVVEADGFAFHSDRAAYRRDRERMNQLERLGWKVLRFTWEDVQGRPAHVAGIVAACLGAVAAA
ncbi:MAG: hypothetical protein JWM40_690 [Frankiales bacterium]|nr:hypothetical protein [Frankiales bacterium]